MKKLISLWFILTIIFTAGTLIFSACPSAAIEQGGADSQREDFVNKLGLLDEPVIQGTSTASPLTIRSKEGQTNLNVETQSPISLYVGAVEKAKDAPEDILPHLDNRTGSPLESYHLETGVGLRVNKRAAVNLGYRFNDSPFMFDSQRVDISDGNGGDLRFSLEIKLPF